MKKKFLATVLGTILSFQLSSFALAQEPPASTEPPKMATEGVKLGDILSAPGQKISPNIGLYITRFVNFLALIIGSFAFLAIVVGGVILLTSGGREAELTKGKDIIKYAIMGIVVALSAYWITAIVQSIFYEAGA